MMLDVGPFTKGLEVPLYYLLMMCVCSLREGESVFGK